ncbi:hypothetical protein RC98_21105 [Pectobacterium carotovorum subsp. carotovorum]|uniref:SIR2 family protein n=1 Tax=Pectobacterium carotovorum TaxID=554 RepID=UPI00057FF816|nr:SIR2 family protein [Pectobacterium carotovorum]KHT23564.1 hypothetical protein RC98_21105 [Pectobacterium carotovorum subsp. carotovorum]
MANENIERKLYNKKRTVKDLSDYIKTKSGSVPNYSLFLGAGASVTSGIKTAIELVSEWRREIYLRLSEEKLAKDEDIREWLSDNERDWYDPSNEYSSLFEKKLDLPSQRRRFVEEQVDRKLPSIGYAYLVELFEHHYFDTVFTTNFDDLINEAFYQFSGERPLLCAHDSSIKGISITSSRPKIIKLHGDYLFDGIKSSLNETESLEANTKEKLIEFTKEYGLIFVGYAGNDKSIMDVINALLKQDDYLKNGIYWCQRKTDEISPELFSFLSKNKVYWVEIDGFDELMAELFYEITKSESLSLGVVQKSTKRDRIISGFLEDQFSLSKNKIINNELVRLRKYSLTQDISSLINELSESKSYDQSDDKIPEVEFKNLLHVDNLIRNKKFEQAEKDIERYMDSGHDVNIKTKYIQRLIDMYDEVGDIDKAISQSEKLLKIDPYNINYYLIKSDLIKNNSEKIEFLKSILDKFKYSVSLRNSLSQISLEYLNERDIDKKVVNFNNIDEWLEASLSIDPSLDNMAWGIKQQYYVNKYENSFDPKERNKDIEALHERMSKIHPEHSQLLHMKSRYATTKDKIEDINVYINYISDVYKKTNSRSKRYLLKDLCDIHNSLFDNENREHSVKLLNEFLLEHLKESDEDIIAPLLICKAKYELAYERNVDNALKYALRAVDSKWNASEADEIYSILSISEEHDEVFKDFINNLPNDYSDVKRMRLLSEISLKEGDFSLSLDYLNKALSAGLAYSSFLINKTFLDLCQENYEGVISDVDSNIDFVSSLNDKHVLIVNREFAKKQLGLKIKESDLRSIIAHQHAKNHASMCAYFILDDEFNANKILKNKIEHNYSNYYVYFRWPVIPNSALTKFKYEKSKAA